MEKSKLAPGEVRYVTNPAEIGKRIKTWRERENPDGDEEMSQATLAQKCGCAASKIGKIERGVQALDIDTAFAIAAVFGTTIDDVYTGRRNATKDVYIRAGLTGEAVNYIQKKATDKPEFVNLLNILLSDETLADTFFRTILIYLNAQMIKIVPLVQKGEDQFLYIDTGTQKEMVTSIVTQRLSKLLAVLYDKWEEAVLPDTAAKIRRIKRRDKRRKTTTPAETMERVKRKAADAEWTRRYGAFDTSGEMRRVDDDVKRLAQECLEEERYRKLEQLLEEMDITEDSEK